MGKGKRLVFVAVAAALMVIAMYSAGCGGESTSTTADAGKKIGDPVDATQISADCKEPQACEKAVEFHNLILEGSYLDAFDLIYYDPANSVAMDKQQRIRDTWTDTLKDFYKIDEAQVSGFEITSDTTGSNGDQKIRYKARALMADGTEKKVDVSLTLKKQDGKWTIVGWSMMH